MNSVDHHDGRNGTALPMLFQRDVLNLESIISRFCWLFLFGEIFILEATSFREVIGHTTTNSAAAAATSLFFNSVSFSLQHIGEREYSIEKRQFFKVKHQQTLQQRQSNKSIQQVKKATGNLILSGRLFLANWIWKAQRKQQQQQLREMWTETKIK